jgi:hypothetical protein
MRVHQGLIPCPVAKGMHVEDWWAEPSHRELREPGLGDAAGETTPPEVRGG